MGEQVVNEEMHQAKDTDVFPGTRIDRDSGFHTELEVFPEPDEPRIDRPGRLTAAAAVKTGIQREFDQGDHAIEGRTKPYIFDEGLQILQVVLQGDPPTEGDRVRLDLLRDLPTEGSHLRRHRLPTGGDIDSEGTRQRAWPEEGHRLWQVAEALAKEEAGGERRKRVRADGGRACAPHLGPQAKREQRFRAGTRDELVFGSDFQVPKAVFRTTLIGIQVQKRPAKREPQARREPLGVLRSNLCRQRWRCLTLPGFLDVPDQEREFVRDKWIINRQRGGEKALAREA